MRPCKLNLLSRSHDKRLPCPYKVKVFKSLYPEQESEKLGFGMSHCGCGLFNVCLTNDPGFTIVYFTIRSNVFPECINSYYISLASFM